jgi:hypothetical protein
MDSLIHADIFFFVTTIAVVVIGAFAVVALAYLIKLLRRGREIAEQVRAETVLVRADIQRVRDELTGGQFLIRKMGAFAKNFFPKKKNSRSNKQ